MRGKTRMLSSPPAVAADATARLEDRHLAEILLRLPSPASLALAALVCPRWRRISISPAFLRRFHRLHPPQLVGFFICNGGWKVERVGRDLISEVLEPTFLPVLPPPPGVGGCTVRCGDFSLSVLPSVDHWSLADASDGLLLLCSKVYDDRMNIPHNFVVCDPVSSRSVLVANAPIYELDCESAYLGSALTTVEGEAGSSTLSFEVILVTYFMHGPRLCVFSSRTGQWTVLPEANCGKWVMPMLSGVGDAAHANGCVYWVMDDDSEAYLLVLETRTKQFTTIKLLASMRGQYEGNMRVIRTEGGELRMVAMARGALHLWHLDRSRSTKGRWVREGVLDLVHFEGALDLFLDGSCGRIMILDAGEGIAFLKKSFSDWVFALNLESMRAVKLPHEKYSSGPALPYRMALSPPLPNLPDQGRDG